MLTLILGGLSSGLKALASGLDLLKAKFSANQAPEIKANATAAQDQKQEDQIIGDVKSKNADAVARDIAS